MNIIESNLAFKPLTYSNIPVMIVLHHAEASKCTVEDVHRWHLNNGWSGIGYHFFIRKDGSIYRGRPENALGAHCIGANDKSIGICCEGTYMTETMPVEQKSAVVELCKYLIEKYSIKQIYGHKELYATSCPGTNYPLAEIKEAAFKKNKYYVVTNYLPATEYGVEFNSLYQKYFTGTGRIYLKSNDKGIWIETQYLSKEAAQVLADKLKQDNLLWSLVEE